MRAEHLELYALGELPNDLSGVVESHLKTCVSCGVQFEESRAAIGEWIALADRPDAGFEQRTQRRMPTDDPAVLTVLKPERSPRLKMRILDASQHGLKLLISQELMRGALVQLYVRDRFIMAEVRYCRPAGKAFHVGVQIQDVFPAAG
jgi:hypothetical protein